MNVFEPNQDLGQRLLDLREVIVRVQIRADSTAANKKQSCDLSSVGIVRSQGLTASADAVATWPGSTAVDGAGTTASVFGLLLKGSELGTIDRIVELPTVFKRAADTSSGSYTVTLPTSGAFTQGLDASGNIALNLSGLAALNAAPGACVDIDIKILYLKK